VVIRRHAVASRRLLPPAAEAYLDAAPYDLDDEGGLLGDLRRQLESTRARIVEVLPGAI